MREESRVEEAESGDWREKDLAEGRDDRIEEERVVGDIVNLKRRYRVKITTAQYHLGRG